MLGVLGALGSTPSTTYAENAVKRLLSIVTAVDIMSDREGIIHKRT